VIFTRPHQQRIAKVLESLDADLLKRHNCLFARCAAIALRHAEDRESVDTVFLASHLAPYRHLRTLAREQGVQALMKSTDTGQFQTLNLS
jgi:hypothetical protein